MKKYILLFVFVCACLGQSTSFPPNSSGGPVGPYVIDFNTRSNHVTLSSGDVTTALGFTPAGLGANTFTGTQIATNFQTSGDGYYAFFTSATRLASSSSAALLQMIVANTTAQTWTASNVTFNLIPKFSGTNTTGSGTALLGSNSPAVTNTAPYTWIQIVTSDGSTAFVPAWK